MDKKKFLTLKKVIVFIAVLLIPIMYSFFYLKSYWDPYGKLENMTIAMVNLDKGGDEGQNLGQDFIDALIDKDVVNIAQVDEDEAQRGLVEEDYFAIITVPENFTEYLSSAADVDKHIATITYAPNQKYNYLASQIINKIVTSAEATLESQVSEQVVETLSNSLEEIPESLEQIDDGADQLLDGANSLSDGLNQINDGVGTLNNSYSEFDQGINSAYTGSQALTNGIGQVNTGVGSLSTGANTLDQAIGQINDGANTLSTQAGAGINTLVSGINELASGTNSLAEGTTALVAGTASDSELGSGAATLDAGVTQYVNSVNGAVPTLIDSTSSAAASNTANTMATTVNAKIAENAAALGLNEAQIAGISGIVSNVAGGVSGPVASAVSAQVKATPSIGQLATSGESLKAGATKINAGITTLNSKVQELNAGAQKINAGTAQLASQETAASLNKLVSGMGTLQNALAQVKSGTETLKTGVGTLGSGTSQLQTGSQTLTNGLGTLSGASSQVKSALGTLQNGTQSAYDGSVKLRDGIQELKDGVEEGMNEANEQMDKLDGLSEFVKDSVEIEEVDYGEIDAYGTAFTPLFISVALWVGSLMAYVVFYYDQDKRFKILGKFADNKLIQIPLYLGIAVLQGLVTGFLLDLGLDMEITSYPLYYGSCVLIAITFMTIIQFFIMNFGEVGKFFGLLVLVLQLASSGGTFPVALIDEGFQKLSPYLPMTYTIKLTKEAVISQRDGVAGHNIGIMMAYTLICLGITIVVELVKKAIAKNKQKDDMENK